MTTDNNASELTELRARLRWSQDEMGRALGVSREWISRLENGRGEFSEFILLKIKTLATEQSHHNRVMEPPAAYGATSLPSTDPTTVRRHESSDVVCLSKQKREPSTRAECERYFALLMAAAEASDNPNSFPVIHDRLEKLFPFSEWEEKPPS